ncbi:MAG TPA: permease-like cell division protein FtsX [Polyangia bacterium]|nr:permease-like cell division protein FtsX [Polyangia bacterium]
MTIRPHAVLHLLGRSLGGFRRRPFIYLLSVITLAAAFLSFVATLTAALNLDALLDRWVGDAELTVYLEDGASPAETEGLASAVAAVEGVARVEAVTPEQARERFAADLGIGGELVPGLPAGAFPASLEVHLSPGLARDAEQRRALAARLGRVDRVGDVELYDDWFERLSALGLIGRLSAWGLGLLALVVAVLVVAATVRSGVASRRREIEVLRFVGATDRYVRAPFLIEGVLEIVAAMGLALLGLHLLLGRVETVAGQILPLVGGSALIRPGAAMLFALALGGIGAGLLGARLTLRRFEES